MSWRPFGGFFANALENLMIKVVRKISGASKDDWNRAISEVLNAEEVLSDVPGEDKFNYVKGIMRGVLATAAGWALDFLIQSAVSYLKKRGEL